MLERLRGYEAFSKVFEEREEFYRGTETLVCLECGREYEGSYIEGDRCDDCEKDYSTRSEGIEEE